MKTTFTLLFLICSAQLSFCQQKDIQKEFNKDGTISFLNFKNEKIMKGISEASNLLRDSLKMRPGNVFELQNIEKGKLGFETRSYAQFYKGIKVAHGAYSVHIRNDKIQYISGNYKDIEDVNISPSLDEQSALKKALSYIKAKKYKWEDELEEENIKKIKNNESASYFPKGEFFIVKDFLKSNNNYRLAYKFDIYAAIPLSHKIYYIDALNGDLLDTQELIMETNVNGTAQTRYSGSQNIVGDSFSGGFRLRELRNGVEIQTYNMNLGTNYGSVTDFSDNDNNWTSPEHNNSSLDNSALDAHWAAEKVYDYFLNTHGRNSYNKKGAPLLNYIHANLVAMGFGNNVNAFWDGQRMTYGDGGGIYGPIVSLDVVAHEIGHGVLQNSGISGGLRYSGESGALNEGLSDIWGSCVEAQAAPAKQRWLIGEDLGSPFRSMSNPNSYGDPDTYNGTNWKDTNNLSVDNGGVHSNSGVLNYWFFLLTDGGTGTNDINNSFNVNGIGMNDSQAIVYKTLNEFLSTNYDANFNFTRTATIQSAIDLFGSGSCQEINVINAWYAVGVGAAYQSSMTIQGPPQFCTSENYTIPNLPVGATVIWSINPSSGVADLSVSSNVATLTKTYGGSLILTASISSNCGTIVLTKPIIVSDPPDSYFTSTPHNGINGKELRLLTDYQPNATYQWVQDGSVVSTSIGYTLLAPNCSNQPYQTEFTIELKVTNDCGIVSERCRKYLFNCSNNSFTAGEFCGTIGIERMANGETDKGFSFYPNPANATLSIKYNAYSEQEVNNNKKVKLINKEGRTLLNANFTKKQNTVTFNTSEIEEGIYFLHFTNGKESIVKQIIINH